MLPQKSGKWIPGRIPGRIPGVNVLPQKNVKWIPGVNVLPQKNVKWIPGVNVLPQKNVKWIPGRIPGVSGSKVRPDCLMPVYRDWVVSIVTCLSVAAPLTVSADLP